MSTRRLTILASVVASFAVFGATASEAETIPERLMEDLRDDFGFEEFQAAGVAGNLARETGNFRYLQELNPLVEGSRGGLGYSQWTGPRRVAFEDWIGDMDPTSYEANYGYLYQELTGDYAYVVDRVLTTKTAEEAAAVFMDGFLRPHPNYEHLDERVAYATAYLDGDFSGAGCQESHEVEVSGRMMVVSLCPEPMEVVYLPQAVSVYARSDIADLIPAGLESDIEIVLADLMSYDQPLRSAPGIIDEMDPLRSEAWRSTFGGGLTETIERRASYSKTSRDVIYGMIDLNTP
ncbi:hypothetical protein LCGC14_0043340 [marine sediment metagenome]|uniref:Phage tail lysozyme domain-containing protein n=2 Tax=root TaxID=1 RepID=A0A7V1BHM3_9RHOB|nr:phage tail tip lysozyme [Sulfitobacter litoralis]HDZ53391.1 hypothetical protein [Sulfitobacter litoralis]